MIAYRNVVLQVGGSFAGYMFTHVDKKKNEKADALSRFGSLREIPPQGVFLDILISHREDPERDRDQSTTHP
jgi:hypothetical protein